MKRVRFRAWRRGFREADLILGPFADRHAQDLSADDLAKFETLLDQPDPLLYAWILGTQPIPAMFDNQLMRRLRAFRPPVSPASVNADPQG
ncbi:MAG TPA: succinate dehydrogenase assembly factor 2 [Caulobacteraceae bacterium]